ncbi:hypothetical protein C5167_038098 [Papaver somniferum]|uniref:Ovate family protein n=1 Tax=Papaver somniferum TaxID=3469 RepID=A0A4Y7ICN3_PAPSO|nr:hypothetical protein C5167_038098 [Papaver somniferum]
MISSQLAKNVKMMMMMMMKGLIQPSCKHPKTDSFRGGADDVFEAENEYESDELVIARGLRADGLFFEPDCIINEEISMDSDNPYDYYRKSMEEMIEAHGLKIGMS